MNPPVEIFLFIQEDLKILRPCLLTGEPTHNRAVFEPDEKHRLMYGVKPGQRRFFVYACADPAKWIELQADIEAAILGGFRSGSFSVKDC